MSTVLQERIEQIQRLAELVKKQQAEVKAAADLLRVDFEAYITDRSVPLETRWTFWTNAPKELKKAEPWIQHFYSNGRKLNWFDDGVLGYCYSKLQTVYMQEVVEMAIEDEDEEVDLDDFKEQVLAKNLYSFVLDW